MSAGAAIPEALESGPHEPPKADKGKRLKRRRTPYLLLFPGVLWLAVFFIVPMIFLLQTSLQKGSPDTGYTFGLGNWHNYTDSLSLYRAQFLRSFLYAGIATLLCLAIGYPLAYAIAFRSGKWKGALLVLVIAPFFTSFIIRTLAWKTLLADDGVIVGFFNWSHLNSLMKMLTLTTGDRILATPLATITGLTYNFLPFMALPLYASLDRVDSRLVEAASDLYCSPFTAFRKVTWPLSLPGVVAGTLLTFIPAAGDYINQALLGRPGEGMIGNVIQSTFLEQLDYPTAAALSFTLMLTIVVLVSIYVRRSGTEKLV
ncbi:MAG: spermidine/putrescine transport system permease protein [Actinomycetota bacterium]|nr:spermidine/putrescine transport system permease protein [Actinomycetota bacterium]